MHNIGGSLFPNLAEALADLGQIGSLPLPRQVDEPAHCREDIFVLTGEDRHSRPWRSLFDGRHSCAP
jgi:hypothetical protein